MRHLTFKSTMSVLATVVVGIGCSPASSSSGLSWLGADLKGDSSEGDAATEEEPAASCVGRCGVADWSAFCQCDAECQAEGTCCADFVGACAAQLPDMPTPAQPRVSCDEANPCAVGWQCILGSCEPTSTDIGVKKVYPDLKVVMLGYEPGLKPVPGFKYETVVEVLNIGDKKAGPVSVSVGCDSPNGLLTLATGNLSGEIKPDASKSVTIYWTCNSQCKNKLWAIVDPKNAIKELDESNNKLSGYMPFAPSPSPGGSCIKDSNQVSFGSTVTSTCKPADCCSGKCYATTAKGTVPAYARCGSSKGYCIGGKTTDCKKLSNGKVECCTKDCFTLKVTCN